MFEWMEKPIKSLGRVVTGKTPPKVNNEYFENGKELFVSPKDLDWDHFYVNETQTVITEKALEKFKNQVLPKNAVMFTSLSFAFGKMGIASKNCLTNQQINSIIVNNDHDFRFVYYLLKTYRPIIFSYNSGIDTPIVPKSVFEAILVKCPLLETQKKIAAILCSYDDYIENNKRRIALLENMAEEIYREWFVRFRFPGYKTAEFEKGIPKSWEVKKIGDIYKTASGGTPSRKNDNNYDGDINWLKTGELKNKFVFDSEEKITLQGLESSSAKTFPAETVVIAMYCAMPDITILAEPSATNQACCAFLPKEKYLSYIYTYYLIKFSQIHMIQYAHGAAQQNLSQDLIKGFNLLLADKESIQKFGETIEPIFEEIKILMRGNENLTKTKESLLPRLISGKLSVEDLDIQFPPSMQEENAA
ncbi:MAG: type I restriction enzyme S subunit [Cycloclasticus sp.]|jgi:type I restriction enzyme S subunit